MKDDKGRLAQRLWCEFASLPLAHPAIVDLVQASQPRRVARGEAVVVEGDEGGTVYLVASGVLRIVRYTQGGHEVWYADIGPGELTGDMAVLTGSRRTSTVIARTAATIFAIERDAFLAVVSKYQEFTLAVARMLAERLQATSTHLAELAALPVTSRVHGELVAMGSPAPGDSEMFEIVAPPTVITLSQRVHATREATSRALTVLAKRGLLIRARKHWQVIVPTEDMAPG